MASIEEGSTNKKLLSDGASRWDMSNAPLFAGDRSRNVKSKEALRDLTARRAANIALEAIRGVAGPDAAEQYRKRMPEGENASYDQLKPLINEINQIVKEDRKTKMTDLDSYQSGDDYNR